MSLIGQYRCKQRCKLCISDWTEQVSVLYSKDERQNQGFPAVVGSDSVNSQGVVGEAESSVWGSSRGSVQEAPISKELLDSYYHKMWALTLPWGVHQGR